MQRQLLRWLGVGLVAVSVASVPLLLRAADEAKAPQTPRDKATGEAQKKMDALATAYGLIDYGRELIPLVRREIEKREIAKAG